MSKTEKKHQDKEMSLLDHLVELRKRLFRSVIIVLLCFIISFSLSDFLLNILSIPIKDPLSDIQNKLIEQESEQFSSNIENNIQSEYQCSCVKQTNTEKNNLNNDELNKINIEHEDLNCHCKKLVEEEVKVSSPFVFIQISEVFISKIKIGFWVGLFLSLPFLFGQIWLFVAPALFKNEKKIFLSIIYSSIFCFICGALFCYYIVFPNGFHFLLNLGDNLAIPTISLNNYLNFSLVLLFVFGIVFELPVICGILAYFDIINAPFMLKYSRYVIVLIFTIAAIFTPPDPMSMILMGIPLVGLYFISYLLIGLTKGFK